MYTSVYVREIRGVIIANIKHRNTKVAETTCVQKAYFKRTGNEFGCFINNVSSDIFDIC